MWKSSKKLNGDIRKGISVFSFSSGSLHFNTPFIKNTKRQLFTDDIDKIENSIYN